MTLSASFPEGGGVVALMEVAELVDDEVVHDGLGHHHALPVEGEAAAG
jgi:hypothetical protein